MKKNQNFKDHINYFKKTDTLKYVGGVFAVLGVLLYMFGWSYVSYILATILLPSGGVLFLIGSSGRASDSDMKEYISKRTEGIELDLENNPSIKKRLLRQLSVEVVEGYEYNDGVMATKAKNGSVITSEYTKSLIYPLADAVYVVSRSISLISDEAQDTAVEVPYSQIKDIRLEKNSMKLIFCKKSFGVWDTRFVIEYDGGKLISLPARDNASLDSFMETLKRTVSSAK